MATLFCFVIIFFVGMHVQDLLMAAHLKRETELTEDAREDFMRMKERYYESNNNLYKLQIEHKSQRDAYIKRLSDLNLKQPPEDFKIMEDY